MDDPLGGESATSELLVFAITRRPYCRRISERVRRSRTCIWNASGCPANTAKAKETQDISIAAGIHIFLYRDYHERVRSQTYTNALRLQPRTATSTAAVKPATAPPYYLTNPNAVLSDIAQWDYGKALDYGDTRRVWEQSLCFTASS